MIVISDKPKLIISKTNIIYKPKPKKIYKSSQNFSLFHLPNNSYQLCPKKKIPKKIDLNLKKTKSEKLKLAYHDYILKITGLNEKNKRNKRDNVYNIVLAKTRCWKICDELYKNDNIHLNRKYNKYLEILEWRKQYE